MKVGLIAMSGLRAQNSELMELGLTLPGFIERKEVIASLPSLGLLTLASFTPAEIEVEYLELAEFTSDSSVPVEFDAVAISSFTAQINDAYLLADKYRALGAKVILGGLHVSSMPDEASEHADAILLGEGELLWNTLICDLVAGKLKPIYDARGMEFDFRDSLVPRYELLDVESYNRLTVQTQRGCPFRCEFCASSIRLTGKYKVKPIAQVVREIESIKALWKKPFIELADDNTFASKAHARKLARVLGSLDIKWFTETDVSVAEDDELLAILSDSGCRQLLIGFEAPQQQSLHNLELKRNWKEEQLDNYHEAIHRIQRRGISVNGCFILGLDGQDDSIFDETLQFVKESELSEVQITLQTPFPGTELYRRLRDSNRLLAAEFWDQCTLFDVTFVPDRMSALELERGFADLMSELYSEELVRGRKAGFVRQARKLKMNR